MGSSLSLALHSHGTPGVAYTDSANADLKFAKFTGTGWDVSVVDSKGSVGQYPSLQFDALDQPLISYYYKTRGDLRLASLKNGVWQIATLDAAGDVGRSSALARNPISGVWSVAYDDSSNHQLRFVQLIKGGSQFSVIDSSSDGGGFDPLAFDLTAHPAVSYFDFTNTALKFAKFNGVSWNTQTIASKGNQGTYSNLSYRPDGLARLVYFNKTANSVLTLQGDSVQWSGDRLSTGGGRALTAAYDRKDHQTIAWMNDAAQMLLVQADTSIALPERMPVSTSLTATALSSSRIQLDWTSSASNPSGYWIERSPDGLTNWATLSATDGDTTTFVNAQLQSSTDYYYRVRPITPNFTPLL